MRYKSAGVCGDEAVGFADAHAGRLLTYDPASDNGIITVEIRQRAKLLDDIAFRAIITRSLCINARTFQSNIRAFAGEERFDGAVIR